MGEKGRIGTREGDGVEGKNVGKKERVRNEGNEKERKELTEEEDKFCTERNKMREI